MPPPPPTSPPFPYTTLFRSHAAVRAEEAARVLDVEVALDRRLEEVPERRRQRHAEADQQGVRSLEPVVLVGDREQPEEERAAEDRKSTRLNSSHMSISYAVF